MPWPTAHHPLEGTRCGLFAYPYYAVFDRIVLENQARLVISGKITEAFKKRKIESFCEEFARNVLFINEVKILAPSQLGKSLRVSVARSIYADPVFVKYSGQVPLRMHIIVENGNVSLNGDVGSRGEPTQAAPARTVENILSPTNSLDSAIAWAVASTLAN